MARPVAAAKAAGRAARRGHEGPRDTRTALVQAALELMAANPWERVSARAIAEAAGVDPALITHHFGGRSGLVVAVAEEATKVLRDRMTLRYDEQHDVAAAIRSAIEDPVSSMVMAPLWAELYVAELLLRGDAATDALLHELAVPYYATVERALDAAGAGETRDVDRGLLLYAVAALALFPFFLRPLGRRHSQLASVVGDPMAFVSPLVDLVLTGALDPSGKRSPGRKRARTSGGVAGPGSQLDLTQQDLVEAALELLRDDPETDLTPAGVALRAGLEPGAAASLFPDDAAFVAMVARAAARQLPRREQGRRKRGRPVVQNPQIREDLVRAATDLITAGPGPISASAVAERVECDPALITYYFGGRRGLQQAVAEAAVEDLVARFHQHVDPALAPGDRLAAAVTPVVQRIAERAWLFHMVLDEFLLQGTTVHDQALATRLAPMVHAVRTMIDEGVRLAVFRSTNRTVLFYGLFVLLLYLPAAIPLFERAHSVGAVELDPPARAGQIVGLVMNGLCASRGRRR